MKQLSINEQNYQMACGIACASYAMKRLMDAGVPVYDIHVIRGRGYLKTGAANQLEGIMPVSEFRKGTFHRVRALLCGCMIEWEIDTTAAEVAA